MLKRNFLEKLTRKLKRCKIQKIEAGKLRGVYNKSLKLEKLIKRLYEINF
jgi:hypothetical protein